MTRVEVMVLGAMCLCLFIFILVIIDSGQQRDQKCRTDAYAECRKDPSKVDCARDIIYVCNPRDASIR